MEALNTKPTNAGFAVPKVHTHKVHAYRFRGLLGFRAKVTSGAGREGSCQICSLPHPAAGSLGSVVRSGYTAFQDRSTAMS